jgi:putative ABC transport system permease protein
MQALLGTWHAVAGGAWRDAPGRALLAILGIACGVALGAAVHLINATARQEFEAAARALAGVADIVVRGPRQGFDEALYPHVAMVPGVAVASPAIEVDATLAGVRDSIRMLGLDVFRAALVQPALVAAPEADVSELLNADAVWLTHSAAEAFGLAKGDTLRVRVGTSVVPFEVAAIVPHSVYPEPLAIADIATLQWRLSQLGRLQRIDVRVQPGADIARVTRDIEALLPPDVTLSRPDVEASRASAMTRAYRLNLDMLALVALFTGAFLVFSTQFLALMRRRTQFALLRVLGVTRSALRGMLLAEGAVLGVMGSALGVLLGYASAAYVVHRYGVDLGAGYFSAQSAALPPQWGALAAYFALGIVFSMLGAAPPAIEVSRRAPALALRAGDEQDYARPAGRTLTGVALLAAGGICAALPALHGLPWAGYAGIALLLLGTVMIMPSVATRVLRYVPCPRPVSAALAVARAQAAPRQASVTIAAIVTSLSLMVSMIVMVASFRESLDAWLQHMLPADVYLRTAPAGETGFLTPEQQEIVATTPGVARVSVIRSQQVYLRPDRPPLTLLARTIDPAHPGDTLLLKSESISPAPGAPPPIWVSEAVHDVYGWKPGDVVRVPLAGAEHAFTVAGVWRDYARQTGGLVIERPVYVALTHDRLANDAAIWLAPGTDVNALAQSLRVRLDAGEDIELNETASVRARSLAVFDRTFAVTYGLEAVAILIGLLGVSSSFSAQALSRRREFGVLRHLGMTRRQIAAMLGCEGALLATFGAAVGLALGCLIGLVLIHVVNRQSFHWSMDLHLPMLPLAALSLTLIAASAFVAMWSGRYAMRHEAARAVREDW